MVAIMSSERLYDIFCTVFDIVFISLIVAFLLYLLLGWYFDEDCFMNFFRGALVGATLRKQFDRLYGDD
jgi:hypothetical protein